MYQTWMSENMGSVHLESLQGLARYGRRDVWKLTDILVEPELKRSEQLFKELQLIYQACR